MQLSWLQVAGAVTVAVPVGGALGILAARRRTKRTDGGLDVEELPDTAEGHVNLDNVDMAGPRFGVLGALWHAYTRYIRRSRKARQGCVQWFRLQNGTLSGPSYVRPKANEANPIPFVEHDGARYFFPDEAMVSDPETGMWTAFHRTGEADPINLRDGDVDAISAEKAKEWSEMAVTAPEEGGLLDALTPARIIALGVAGLLAYAVFGGGL